MEKFLERYDSKIRGVISTFDRMIFKGHILSFFQRGNRHHYLFREKVLFKDFGKYTKKVSGEIKEKARIWFYACTDTDVVSLSDTNLYQRT